MYPAAVLPWVNVLPFQREWWQPRWRYHRLISMLRVLSRVGKLFVVTKRGKTTDQLWGRRWNPEQIHCNRQQTAGWMCGITQPELRRDETKLFAIIGSLAWCHIEVEVIAMRFVRLRPKNSSEIAAGFRMYAFQKDGFLGWRKGFRLLRFR